MDSGVMEMDIQRQREEKIEFFKAQAQQYNFTREYSKAMAFYVRAGLLGDRDSIILVCERLKSGYGMSYNYEEIYRCMLVGAREGIADAMYELGVCYSTGLGVEPDTAEAMHWFSEGAKAGSEDAKNSLRTYNYDLHIEEEHYPCAYADIVRKSVLGENHKLSDACMDERSAEFVMFDGAKPVASVMMYWDEEHQAYVLDSFCILPEYRGIGIAEDLLNKAIARVRLDNRKLLAVCADETIRPVCRKMGFSEEEIYQQDENDTKVWMYRRFPVVL